MMKSTYLRALAGLAMAGAAVLSQPADAFVLTFDGNICDGVGGGCANGARINQSYGDVAGLDVQYNHNPAMFTYGSDVVGNDARMFWWADGYSHMEHVVYGSPGVEVGIFLRPAAGYQVTLNGFDLGMWPNSTHQSQVTIVDGTSNTVLVSTGFQNFSGLVPTHFAGPYTSAGGIYILWGPDGYNGGLDNIDFSVSQIGGAVPEPSTWAMMLIGFAGLGFATWRRRQTRVA